MPMKYENLAETNSRLIAAMLFVAVAVIAPMVYLFNSISGKQAKHEKLSPAPISPIDQFNDYMIRIKQKDLTLKIIKLKNAKLGDDLIDQLMRALDANPEVSEQIAKLNLSGNKIKTIKFPNLPKLKELDIRYNDMTIIDLSNFTNKLALREVRLNNNPLRPFAQAMIKKFKEEAVANKHTIRIFFDGSCDDRTVQAAEKVMLDFSKNKKMSAYITTNGLEAVSINPDNPRGYRVRKPAAQTCS